MRLHLVVAAIAAAALPSAAPAAPVVTEFSAGITVGARLDGIAPGPDGNVWFTASSNPARIGRITPGGTVNEFSNGLTANSDPTDIAAGPDGNLWFAGQAGNLIGRITPAGAVTEFSAGITTGAQPSSIVAGPDGNLWFTERGKDTIGRITTGGLVSEFSVGISTGARPLSIVAGPDGALWFTESLGDRIGRITTSGAVTEFSVGISKGATPTDIAAGPDGNLWFTESDAHRIGRITTSGVVTEFSAGISPGAAPTGITAGPDGNLWFTEPGGDRIGRITTSGVVTEFSAGISPGARPTGIAAGPGGTLWFTEALGDRVGRVSLGGGSTALPATDISARTATLNARLGTDGLPTTYRFEYGTTASYGLQTRETSASSTTAATAVSEAITGLEPGTLYHFRLTATNASGAAPSPDMTFTTAPEGFTSPPEVGRTVGARPLGGRVLVRAPGSTRAALLLVGSIIPSGSLVDATHGRVELVSATPDGYQTGTFWGGAFRVRQLAAGGGMVDLFLAGPRLRCASPRVGSHMAAEHAPSRRGRSLWASDHKGKFRTHGRDSVATVRGTRWLTRERCDGTLTRVVEGAVVVRDLRLRRSVLVRAGRSYLARRFPR